MKILFSVMFFLAAILFLNISISEQISANAQSSNNSQPLIKESDFLIEEYVSGLKFPTTFDFIDNHILVLEKDGNIRLVKDGVLVDEPIKKIDVSTTLEEGLLGILTNENSVYIHYTTRDSDTDLTSNWFYKFNWDGENLIEPILLKEIHDGSYGHNSGVMEMYNDQVIMVIGDLFNRNGLTQNNLLGEFDHTSVIMPIDPLGEPLAIGIRNSFGLDVDPKTGFLWDTENGDVKFDEINLITSNFNSGWNLVQGPATEIEKQTLEENTNFIYNDPKFSWERTIGVTAIHFVTSPIFNSYDDVVLVGAFHNGNLYKFHLNSERNGFVFQNQQLMDNVLHENDDSTEIIFATGFQGITDIKEGPDGNIYLLSIGDGKIFKISPNFNEDAVINDICRQKILEGEIIKNCNLSNMDLSNMDLSNMDLSNMDLSFSNFENSNLTNTSFKNSNIVNSSFLNSKILETDFSYSNLESSIFLNNVLKNVNFSNSNMKSSNLKNSSISDTNFHNTNLEFASLSNSIIKNSNFSESYLYYSDFSFSKIIELDFSFADLSFAKFNNVDASYSNFSDSRLWKTQLNISNLTNTNFENSDNYFSTYLNTNLQNSNFTNSRFSDVDFTNSDMSGSFLLDVYPMNSNFENVRFDQNTKINTCLNSDLTSKIINRIIRTTNANNSPFLEPLRDILISICN